MWCSCPRALGVPVFDADECGVGVMRQWRCRDAMKKGKCKLMEPIMKVDVLTPEDHMGDVIGDLNSRRGMVEGFTDRPGGMKMVAANVPLAAMFNYVSNLRSMTKGRGSYQMKLSDYAQVPPNIQEEIVAEARGATA